MDLDTLIRDADPNRRIPPADARSVEAEQTFQAIVGAHRPAHGGIGTIRFKRRTYVVALMCAVVVVAGAVLFVSNPAVSPSSASTLLNEAAVRAALEPQIPPLGPGQYFYQQTVTLQNCTFISPAGQGASTEFVYITPMVVETWTTANGSGIERSTPQGPGHFQTAEEATRFASSGLTNGCVQVAHTRSIPASTPQHPGVAALPTNPQTLEALIASGRLNDVGQVAATATTCPSKNGAAPQIYVNGEVCSVAAQFDIVNNLLASPEGPAKLGGVLYQVMSELPGVKIIGTRTDAIGRTGTAVEDPSSGDVLVLDKTTGALLETQTLTTGSAPQSGATPGLPIGTVLNSTTYATSGLVSGEGVTPQR